MARLLDESCRSNQRVQLFNTPFVFAQLGASSAPGGPCVGIHDQNPLHADIALRAQFILLFSVLLVFVFVFQIPWL
jgi:hypothetical protein